MRLAAVLLVLMGFVCAPGSSPPREESRPPAGRGDDLPDSLARAHELVASLELQALGNEPFWSVEITRRPGSGASRPNRVPYVPTTTADSRRVFETLRPDSAPHAIRVAIEERGRAPTGCRTFAW